MADRAIGKHGNVGGPATDVDHGHPKFCFVVIEDGITRGDLFEHDFLDVEPASGDAFDDVLGGADRARNDVYLGLKTDPAHANGFANAVLAINDEVLGKNVQHLLIIRDGLRLRRIEDPFNVFSADLIPILDGGDTAGVHAVDMSPGNTRVNRTDPALRCQFCLLDGLLDRLHGGIDVGHHTFTQTP